MLRAKLDIVLQTAVLKADPSINRIRRVQTSSGSPPLTSRDLNKPRLANGSQGYKGFNRLKTDQRERPTAADGATPACSTTTLLADGATARSAVHHYKRATDRRIEPRDRLRRNEGTIAERRQHNTFTPGRLSRPPRFREEPHYHGLVTDDRILGALPLDIAHIFPCGYEIVRNISIC